MSTRARKRKTACAKEAGEPPKKAARARMDPGELSLRLAFLLAEALRTMLVALGGRQTQEEVHARSLAG